MSKIELPRPESSTQWTIYGASSWCGSCRRVKAFLDKKNEKYTYYELGNDMNEVRKFIESFSDITNGNTKVPMVFHFGKFIEGGCAGTISLYKQQYNGNPLI